MTKPLNNPASKRTKTWRNKRLEADEKNITVWLHSSTVDVLDTTAKSLNQTRAETITSAINTLSITDTDTHHNRTSTVNDGPVSADVSVMQRTIDELSKQLDIKDHQINELIESTKQSNMLLGGMQKAMGLLEAPQENHEEPKVKATSSKKGKKPKGKGSKKKKKK